MMIVMLMMLMMIMMLMMMFIMGGPQDGAMVNLIARGRVLVLQWRFPYHDH